MYIHSNQHNIDINTTNKQLFLKRHLRGSDVAAARTQMPEGGFSKRDAFVLLDADCRGNHLSNTTCLTHVFFKRGQSCSKC